MVLELLTPHCKLQVFHSADSNCHLSKLTGPKPAITDSNVSIPRHTSVVISKPHRPLRYRYQITLFLSKLAIGTKVHGGHYARCETLTATSSGLVPDLSLGLTKYSMPIAATRLYRSIPRLRRRASSSYFCLQPTRRQSLRTSTNARRWNQINDFMYHSGNSIILAKSFDCTWRADRRVRT